MFSVRTGIGKTMADGGFVQNCEAALAALANAAQGARFWETFAASFAAILLAGLLVSGVNYLFIRNERKENHLFQKRERWYKIADSFCANLEGLFGAYFAESGKDKRAVIAKKILAHLVAFMIFVENPEFVKDKKEIRREYAVLLDFQHGASAEEDSEKLQQALIALAEIRNHLTK